MIPELQRKLIPGATIIDGMDTLYIMGFKERFQEARKWVEMSMDFSSIRGEVSVFETNIRFIGGLLAAYALTKDDLFRTKAKQVADLLLPAFDTPTGIPHGLLNVRNKVGKNWGWASAGSSILSEYGTLHLEFEYLSVVTGESVYAEKVQKIRHVLNSLDKPKGLYPNYLNPKTRKWGQVHVSIGALGDSFYEYLLKQWIVTDGRDTTAKRMYDETMKAFEDLLLVKSPGGLTYFAEMRGSRLEHKMDHLACFTAGLYALQSMKEKNATARIHALQLGRELGRTCRESYVRTETGIGPETFRFVRDVEAKTLTEREKYYILRPEAIEGWFYLWRATKEQMYRDWAWEAAQAIERYCRDEAGYSGIRNVYDKNSPKDDVQQSFFLAETLKYLFLIFSDDSVLSLNEWVFNTEAHPLPVRPEAHAAELRAREVKFV